MTSSKTTPPPLKWDRENEGAAAVIAPGIRLSVHRYVGEDKDKWFVTCYRLDIEKRPLRNKELEAAKKEACCLVIEHITGLVKLVPILIKLGGL